MEHSRQVFRAVLVLILVVAVVTIGRSFMKPHSYGLYGSYRADNVAEQMSIRAPRHAGAASCTPCHADRAKQKAAGGHKAVSCEVCHAPLSRHVADGKKSAPMAVDGSFMLCARCHRKIPGRPEKFPQVILEQHVDGKVEGKVCLGCHDPHSPRP